MRVINHNEMQVITGGYTLEVNATNIGLAAGIATLAFTVINGVNEGIALGGSIGNIAAGAGSGLLVGGFVGAMAGISTCFLAYLAGFELVEFRK